MVLVLLCVACSSAAQGNDQETAKSLTNTENSVQNEQESAPVSDPDFDRAKLIKMAIENQKSSYAPYSGYNVSAAVLMDSGEIYTGANVENASYPAGVCAEHNAINIAVLNGERKIVAIAIVGGADYTVSDYCAPCGICRQVMREFCDPTKMRVIIAISPTDYKEYTLEELLPESFGPSNLE
ncbi:MAG: cytidine deaminase [Clostridia bacterium]|nr:cytidine deaminase [Clostridia bacterium]